MTENTAENRERGTTSFRPRARLIHTIGDDLISSEEVAVVELVKNAYDADARNVLVEFLPSSGSEIDTIVIADNGHGMSLDTVLNDWMQPATSTKSRRKRSPAGRRVLGEKGIGRFAVSQLANELELITRTAYSQTEIRLSFNWSEFDDKQFLDEVSFPWERRLPVDICPGGYIERAWPAEDNIPDKEKNHGTIMRLSRIRTDWDRNKLSLLKTALSRLISPSANADFSITLSLPSSFKDLAGQVEPPASLGHPDYAIEGEISVDGSYDLTYTHGDHSENFTGRHMLSEDGRDARCGPFKIELRAWDRERSSLERLASKLDSTLRDVQQDLNDAAGISIYRDGFRVLPYGDPHNDWLRLDIRRVQNPTQRISNNQVVGSIFISSDKNAALQDQTNREGLKRGQALDDLMELVRVAIVELEKRRFQERRSGGSASVTAVSAQQSQPPSKRTDLFTGINLQGIQSLAQERYANDLELQYAIEEQDRLIARRLDQVKEVFARYSRLATLGQLVDVILHDGRTYLTRIGNEAELGKESAERISDNPNAIVEVSASFEKISGYTAVLSQLFRRIEPFSGRTKGAFKTIIIENIIADVVGIFSTEIKRLGVEVTPMNTQIELRVIPSDVQQIFVNLFQNSLYWLEQVPRKTRFIDCQIKKVSSDEIEVIFRDSGPGVPEQFREDIFLPYFTGKPEGGTGLGLTIAGEAVAEYDGQLELVSSGSGACFRFTLRQRRS